MEENIIKNCLNIYNNNDHIYVDYKNKVCIKPWGYEFLCYESKNIGIWFLNIIYNNFTSLHCHLEKDTIVFVLEGLLEIETIDEKIILNEFDYFYIPKRKFHALKSLFENTKILEMEIYTENINYSDKNDLIRYKDVLKRYDNNYKNSVDIETDLDKYNYFLINNINNLEFKITENIKVSVLNNEIPCDFSDNIIYILLTGVIKIKNFYVKPGSIINDKFISFDNFSLLKIEYNNYKKVKKIVKNDEHLNFILSKNNDKKIILTSGCFDILHKGHIKILQEAKKLGDILIVCLSSDEQIKYLKGNDRPINQLLDRLELLKSIDYIDYIIPYQEKDYKNEKTLDDYMCKINPYYWVKGDDYSEINIRKLHPSLKNIKLIELENNVSSTIIINKIKNSIL